MYYVRGGVFTDTSFTKVIPGTEEEYGPFESYEQALTEWKRRTFTQKLDICTHRMKIERESF
jgi:hypothetical protein